MKKTDRLKKQDWMIAAGICTAVLVGTVFTGISAQKAYAETTAYVDEKTGQVNYVISHPQEAAEATAEADQYVYVEDENGEERKKYVISRQEEEDGDSLTYTVNGEAVEAAETVVCEDSTGAAENTGSISEDLAVAGDAVSFYEALGLVWNKKGFWEYEGKMVKAVSMENGSLTTWGKDTEKENVYLWITSRQEEKDVVFHVEEMSRKDFAEIFNETHPESHLTW